MYDYSSLAPLSQEIASSVPGVSDLRNLPGAVTAASSTASNYLAKDIEKRRGEALAEKAPEIGVDPNFIRTLAQTDMTKALDYMIQATEKFNVNEAEKYVGTTLGSDEFDPTKFTNEDGTPMGSDQARTRWLKDRRSTILRGMESAQSPYVKKAYEGRLTKLDAAGNTFKQQMDMERLNLAKTKDMRNAVSTSLKSVGMGEFLGPQADAAGFQERLGRLNQMIIGAEDSGKQPIGMYAFGPFETTVNQNGWLATIVNNVMGIKDEVARKRNEEKLKGVTSYEEAYKKLAASGDAYSKDTRKINEALYSGLVMNIFDEIHKLTGATMSVEERENYLHAFGVGRGPGAVMRQYNEQLAATNAKRRRQKEMAKQNLRHQMPYSAPGDPDYDAALAQIDQIQDLPAIPEQFINAIEAKTVYLPGDKPTGMAPSQPTWYGAAPTSTAATPPPGQTWSTPSGASSLAPLSSSSTGMSSSSTTRTTGKGKWTINDVKKLIGG